jgi:hypothetical protein
VRIVSLRAGIPSTRILQSIVRRAMKRKLQAHGGSTRGTP